MPDTAEQSPPSDQRLRLPALVEYRRAATKRRAAAFCDAPEYVLGMEVRPFTPATFSMLLAIGSRFICGGRPTEGDVRNYLWFHSPRYSHFGVAGWQRRKARALRPLENALANPWHRLVRRPLDRERYSVMMILAVSEIGSLVDEAFADCPADTGMPGAPIATMEAQLIHRFAMDYRWEPERTRHTPLKQLFQLTRCIRANNGEDVRDQGEIKILEAHLQRRLADIQAKSAKEAAS